MGKRLNEKAARAASRIEHRLTKLRVDDLYHEADHGPRRVELAGVAGGVAHLLEHRLVKMTQRVDFFRRVEMDSVDLVDHVAQQVPALHAVAHAGKHGGD